jgi:hypothetical protein
LQGRQERGREREMERERERDEPKSLDELFHKTKAKPEIYWKENSRGSVQGAVGRFREGGVPPPIR